MYLRPYNLNLTLSPDDTLNLPQYVARALLTAAVYVGTAGDVTSVDENGVTTLWKAVPAGTFLQIAVKRINSTGTGASNLVACYWT